MLTEQELQALLQDLESDRIERTQAAANTDEFAEAMKALGYVNKYGRGILRAEETLSQNGNPSPEYIFQPQFVLVTIWKKP